MSAARSTRERVVLSTSDNAVVENGTPAFELDFQREEIDEQHVQLIKRALADTSLPEERRWRIVQMIMQCSTPNFDQLALAHKALPSSFENGLNPAKTVLLMMEKLKRTSSEFFLPALQYRMRLMELHVAFENQVLHERTQMDHNRILRRRAAPYEKLEPLPNFKKSAKTRALDTIIAAEGNHNTSQMRLRKQMETYTSCGANLKLLVLKIGLRILLALPPCTVHQCNFKLRPLSASRDEKNIEPAEYARPRLYVASKARLTSLSYHVMSEAESNFFLRWLPLLKDKELHGWDQMWTDALLPPSRFWQTHDLVNQNVSNYFAQRRLLPKRKKAADALPDETTKKRRLSEQS